ncbi:hypothetical protein Anas_00666 [Armadillidium nasatum]|uniref:Alpha 1,4-glycosyltransferase domain-containing protein n=1 Tax=Armadillidium nasatum TaxID=96803 RepID=A0A5N5TKG7_9CRUS|nr:hypothetical protein Anas_00666 [Armadillidium nasatum]
MSFYNRNITKQGVLLFFCILISIFFLKLFYEDSKLKSLPIPSNQDDELLSLPFEKSFEHERSIFFIEGFGKDHIPARMICSIESAALAHRNTPIDVMMTSQILRKSEGIKSLLKAYSNVRFLYLNATALYMESPMKEWFLNKMWVQSKFPEINFDDPLRFLLLFKYGGIYLDMDTIVLKNLEKEENFVGLEIDEHINSAIMGFRKGHPLLNDCIEEMTKHFDGEAWGVNGPVLITKIFRRRDDLDKIFEDDNEFANTLLNDPNFLTLHFYNQLTKTRTISLKRQSIFSVLARNLCPITAFVFNYSF